jgi:hypothetical protein
MENSTYSGHWRSGALHVSAMIGEKLKAKKLLFTKRNLENF